MRGRVGPCLSDCQGLADVKQRRKGFWIKTIDGKGRSFGQDRNRIMAMKAFLMAGHNAEIAYTVIGLHLLTEKPRGIFDKNWVRGV